MDSILGTSTADFLLNPTTPGKIQAELERTQIAEYTFSLRLICQGFRSEYTITETSPSEISDSFATFLQSCVNKELLKLLWNTTTPVNFNTIPLGTDRTSYSACRIGIENKIINWKHLKDLYSGTPPTLPYSSSDCIHIHTDGTNIYPFSLLFRTLVTNPKNEVFVLSCSPEESNRINKLFSSFQGASEKYSDETQVTYNTLTENSLLSVETKLNWVQDRLQEIRAISDSGTIFIFGLGHIPDFPELEHAFETVCNMGFNLRTAIEIGGNTEDIFTDGDSISTGVPSISSPVYSNLEPTFNGSIDGETVQFFSWELAANTDKYSNIVDPTVHSISEDLRRDQKV
jgi:hypothetical protein